MGRIHASPRPRGFKKRGKDPLRNIKDKEKEVITEENGIMERVFYGTIGYK